MISQSKRSAVGILQDKTYVSNKDFGRSTYLMIVVIPLVIDFKRVTSISRIGKVDTASGFNNSNNTKSDTIEKLKEKFFIVYILHFPSLKTGRTIFSDSYLLCCQHLARSLFTLLLLYYFCVCINEVPALRNFERFECFTRPFFPAPFSLFLQERGAF